MGYTPNMSPKEVKELDEERGNKFPEDTWPDKENPKEKRPWLVKTPVNKSGDKDMSSGTDILKNWLRKATIVEYAAMDEEDEDLRKTGQIGIDDIRLSASSDGDDILDMADAALEIEDAKKDAKKALTSRSMYIPRPPGGYDRFDIHRSATTATNRAHSKLKGPNGVAPLVGESMNTTEDDAIVRTRTGQDAYKSCNFHGLVHRVTTGCMMCASTLSKSNACKGCGDEMYKQAGGSYACKCGE